MGNERGRAVCVNESWKREEEWGWVKAEGGEREEEGGRGERG